jgi:hypothetical protein
MPHLIRWDTKRFFHTICSRPNASLLEVNLFWRRSPQIAALLSFFVPGLGQIYIGKALRGGKMLFAAIVIGSLHIIWLSIYSLASTDASTFWGSTLPIILHDVFAFWSMVFWLRIVIDAFYLAKKETSGLDKTASKQRGVGE